MRYGIFFNPNAGDGNAEKLAKRMKDKFEQADHSADFLTAPDPEKAVEKVKEAIEEYDGIVAIGGDGSLNIVYCRNRICSGRQIAATGDHPRRHDQ